MTREFYQQRRNDSRPSFHNTSASRHPSRYPGAERSSHPSRPPRSRPDRYPMDRRGENGSRQQRAGYRPQYAQDNQDNRRRSEPVHRPATGRFHERRQNPYPRAFEPERPGQGSFPRRAGNYAPAASRQNGMRPRQNARLYDAKRGGRSFNNAQGQQNSHPHTYRARQDEQHYSPRTNRNAYRPYGPHRSRGPQNTLNPRRRFEVEEQFEGDYEQFDHYDGYSRRPSRAVPHTGGHTPYKERENRSRNRPQEHATPRERPHNGQHGTPESANSKSAGQNPSAPAHKRKRKPGVAPRSNLLKPSEKGFKWPTSTS
ncbi:MAG: hypothetical protein IMW89_12295 [Ktedonobacteraceae bacterium]|nr:hypothetical protein [Ktedonobacteraceae bacterium]